MSSELPPLLPLFVTIGPGKNVNLSLIRESKFTPATQNLVRGPFAGPLSDALDIEMSRQLVETTTDATLVVRFLQGEMTYRGTEAEELNRAIEAWKSGIR